jgi:AmmeMemoRadiSam system protein B/AmmeMemoRadiSam system protein A
MLKNKIIPILMFHVMIFSNSCNSQDKSGKQSSIDRKPAVAGQFYPADSAKLTTMLKDMFAVASPKTADKVFGIICPHAGYIYSGTVAASSFNQVDPDKDFETIFVIGASHRYFFDGASIYNKGNFITPLGTVEVDTALANKIVKSDKVFQCNPDYHIPDHCIEVQLPFLQYHMKKKFKIVPILIGTDDLSISKKIAAGLKPYLNDNNLFVISTDFSHYPKYTDAVANDKATANAIVKNDPAELIKVIKANSEKKILSLETSLCGSNAVIPFLYMTEKMKGITVKEIKYRNSGDVSKDSSGVVGYWSLVFCGDIKAKSETTDPEFTLTDKDKSDLLEIARNTLNTYIKEGKRSTIDTAGFSATLKQNCGAFVTLKINDELRGCIGRFVADKPLYQIVQDMTVSSSTQDYRFTPVSKSEPDKITIEISVLSPLKKISSADDFILGKHGIYMIKGNASGTFLPQVAEETGWTKEQFLGHCAQDKAGIGWDGWKKAELYIYTAIVFGEKE